MDAGAGGVGLLKEGADVGGDPHEVVGVLVSVEELAEARDGGPVLDRLEDEVCSWGGALALARCVAAARGLSPKRAFRGRCPRPWRRR